MAMQMLSSPVFVQSVTIGAQCQNYCHDVLAMMLLAQARIHMHELPHLLFKLR